MRSFKSRLLRIAALAATGGTVFQVGSCVHFASNINPCLSVLVCDPSSYGFLSSNYSGPGVDANVDPFCSFPPFCDAAVDPLISNDQIP